MFYPLSIWVVFKKFTNIAFAVIDAPVMKEIIDIGLFKKISITVKILVIA